MKTYLYRLFIALAFVGLTTQSYADLTHNLGVSVLSSGPFKPGCPFNVEVSCYARTYYRSYLTSVLPLITDPVIVLGVGLSNDASVASGTDWTYFWVEDEPLQKTLTFTPPRQNTTDLYVQAQLYYRWNDQNIALPPPGVGQMAVVENSVALTVVQPYTLNVPAGVNASGSDVVAGFQMISPAAFAMLSPAYENLWSHFDFKADGIHFHPTGCGRYTYSITSRFSCTNATSQLIDYVENFSFDVGGTELVIQPSTVPYDRGYIIANPDKGAIYRWFKEDANGQGGWSYVHAGPRYQPDEANPHKVILTSADPACPQQESTFTPVSDHIGEPNTLQISVFKSGIGDVSVLNPIDPTLDQVFAANLVFADGLGRPAQHLAVSAGSGGEDLIQHQEYDEWGRQLNQFLPYAFTNSTAGNFDPQASQHQANFYLVHPDVAHDAKPYASSVFDTQKDIGILLKSFAPGQDWNNNINNSGLHYTSGTQYIYTTADFSANPIYRFLWNVPGGTWAEKATTDLTDQTHQTYWSQELIVKENRSEDGQITFSFSNLLGQLVASRVMPRGTTDAPLTTYYIYDDLGRLRMTVPPKVSELFGQTSSIIYTGSIIQLAPDIQMGSFVNALCTRYEYDAKGRQTVVYRPGGGKVETVYDLLDRPILSQDQCQRLEGANTWSFVKYDREGRTVLTGDVDGGAETRQSWQDLANQTDQTAGWVWFEKRTETTPDYQGYTNDAFPELEAGAFTLMTVNYYDDYSFKRGNTYGQLNSPDPTQEINAHWPTDVLGAAPTLSSNLQSLPTAKKVRVLHPDLSTNEQWLMDIYYYDVKEQLIATGSDVHFDLDANGADDWHFLLIDPDYGRVLKEYFHHDNQSIDPNGLLGSTLPYWKEYSYYLNGKLQSITQTMAGDDPKKLVSYDYDVFGQVKTKHLALNDNGNALQHIDFKYNIRGWLTHINDPDQILPNAGTHNEGGVPPDADVFGMELKYQKLDGLVHGSTTADKPTRYDGTITGTVWKTNQDHVGRSYTYNYDGFNRLNSAKYRALENTTTSQWGSYETDLFSTEDHRYDANGNLQKMVQNGPHGLGDTSQTIIDQLGYQYEDLGGGVKGNRLTNVNDNGVSASYNPQSNLDTKGQPFRRDYSERHNEGAAIQYSYDEAGRLTADKSKQIKTIIYNRLDLPEKIQFENGANDETSSVITTLYAADGRKLIYTYQRPDGGEGLPAKTVTTHYCDGWVYRLSSEAGRQPYESKLDMAYLNTATGKVVATACMETMEIIDAGTMVGSWLYQHHIYDHQGNLRIAFQEEYTKGKYEAGMEQVNAEREEAEFKFVEETRHEDGTVSRTGEYSAKLNPLEGKPMGPMKWIAVEKGDTVSMEAYAYYKEAMVANSNTWQNSLAGFLLGSLANSVYSPTLENGQPNPAYQQLVLLGSTLASMALGNVTQSDPTVPKAYMKWIHYDKDSVFVSQGYTAISDLAKDEYQKLFLQTVAEKDGYVQFFVANETTKPVYFDDVSGLVRRPRVIQQAHYYPFGLPMAKITTLGNPEYAYFFTGKELYEDEALEWYDHGARMYDVQIGRWTTTDPEWQDASPYIFCGNNAVNYIDPDGRQYWIPGFEGTKLDKWMANNEKSIIKVGIGAALVGLTIATGGTGALVAMAWGAGIGAISAGGVYTATAFLTGNGDNFTGNNLLNAMAYGAVAGAVGAGVSSIGVGLGATAQSIGLNIVSNTASQIGTNLAFGREVNMSTVAGGIIGGVIGQGIFGNFRGVQGSSLKNGFAELGFNVAKGTVSGAFSGSTKALLDGDNVGEGALNGAYMGAVGGAVQTGLNIAMYGTTFKPGRSFGAIGGRQGPAYRRGTFITRALADGRGTGITVGRNLVTNRYRNNNDLPEWLQGNEYLGENACLIGHETAHWNQIVNEGWGSFYPNIISEYQRLGFYDSYFNSGTYENNANIYGNTFGW